ncbi:MAG: hypothetical protein IT211_11915 [Armatimonadetes bacterium]|nr:hypothetical protein [Armatimonadota bacterium]
MKNFIARHTRCGVLVAMVVAIVLGTSGLLAQPTDYRLSIDVTGGYGFRISSSPPPELPELEETSGGGSGSLRALWCPEHLMHVGLDISYLPVSGIRAKNEALRQGSANISLVSLPVMGVIAMEKYGIDLSGGIGMILLRLDGKAANGEQIHSESWEIGYTFGAGYTWQYSERLGVGAEVKFIEFTDRPIGSVIAGLRVRWAMLKY